LTDTLSKHTPIHAPEYGYLREAIEHLVRQPRLRQEFPAPLFLGLSHVAAAIPHFISFEVRTIDTFYRFGFLATSRQRAFIAVLRVEAVIYFAVEISGAMKPRASANEDVPAKPFRAVVARGCTVIRSDIIVTIGTVWG
jgi:hypothetical protein